MKEGDNVILYDIKTEKEWDTIGFVNLTDYGLKIGETYTIHSISSNTLQLVEDTYKWNIPFICFSEPIPSIIDNYELI